MSTMRRMPQNIDVLDAVTPFMEQNDKTTVFGGNLEVDGNLKVNGTITPSGGSTLYRHVVKGVWSSENSYFLLTIISSSATVIDSLTDLKTALGSTFEYPVSGYDGAQDLGYVRITESHVYNTHNAAASLANFTFTDKVAAL